MLNPPFLCGKHLGENPPSPPGNGKSSAASFNCSCQRRRDHHQLLFMVKVGQKKMENPWKTMGKNGKSWEKMETSSENHGKMEVSIIMGYPKMDGFEWNILLKRMIWSYQDFRKPPCWLINNL